MEKYKKMLDEYNQAKPKQLEALNLIEAELHAIHQKGFEILQDDLTWLKNVNMELVCKMRNSVELIHGLSQILEHIETQQLKE